MNDDVDDSYDSDDSHGTTLLIGLVSSLFVGAMVGSIAFYFILQIDMTGDKYFAYAPLWILMFDAVYFLPSVILFILPAAWICLAYGWPKREGTMLIFLGASALVGLAVILVVGAQLQEYWLILVAAIYSYTAALVMRNVVYGKNGEQTAAQQAD